MDILYQREHIKTPTGYVAVHSETSSESVIISNGDSAEDYMKNNPGGGSVNIDGEILSSTHAEGELLVTRQSGGTPFVNSKYVGVVSTGGLVIRYGDDGINTSLTLPRPDNISSTYVEVCSGYDKDDMIVTFNDLLDDNTRVASGYIVDIDKCTYTTICENIKTLKTGNVVMRNYVLYNTILSNGVWQFIKTDIKTGFSSTISVDVPILDNTADNVGYYSTCEPNCDIVIFYGKRTNYSSSRESEYGYYYYGNVNMYTEVSYSSIPIYVSLAGDEGTDGRMMSPRLFYIHKYNIMIYLRMKYSYSSTYGYATLWLSSIHTEIWNAETGEVLATGMVDAVDGGYTNVYSVKVCTHSTGVAVTIIMRDDDSRHYWSVGTLPFSYTSEGTIVSGVSTTRRVGSEYSSPSSTIDPTGIDCFGYEAGLMVYPTAVDTEDTYFQRLAVAPVGAIPIASDFAKPIGGGDYIKIYAGYMIGGTGFINETGRFTCGGAMSNIYGRNMIGYY